jgi:cell division protein ZapD
MSSTVYEFPLNEKVRSYLRFEQLFVQLSQVDNAQHNWQFIQFFSDLFTTLDLLERLEIHTHLIKDIEVQHKNLLHWAKHPQIDSLAIEQALLQIAPLNEQIQQMAQPCSDLKEDKFLSAIKQRFTIPGGTCSFDLPNLHYWISLEHSRKMEDVHQWMIDLHFIEQCVGYLLGFLREKNALTEIMALKGFYQGAVDDNVQLIRVAPHDNSGFYPTLSGNKHRFAIRFTLFEPDANGNTKVDTAVPFMMASC